MRIERESTGALDDLRELTCALKTHHFDLAPELGDVRDDDEFWAIKRAQYERQLAEQGGALFVARTDDGGAVAYAFAVDAVASPTWPADAVFVEDVSVAPHARGAGLGAQLIDAIRAHAAGREVRLYVLAANTGARRFYEREGFAERVIEVSRLPPAGY